ncbi:tRNA (34-2'-O)-methyltransferase regulator Rtt10p [Trichomonascus vanleenenianus]|uniref:tRNA (34-2'-O)-methyltransferase regulator RTT10 n=1 Tax=Trichomonascus vanleenenianus TaxID=2268995 RepID=UPI003ECA2F71
MNMRGQLKFSLIEEAIDGGDKSMEPPTKRQKAMSWRSFKQDAHYGPVTGLCFFGREILLVGEGPRLKVYNWITGQLLHHRKVFPRNKIHGIASRGEEIVIWGGNSIALCDSSKIYNNESIAIGTMPDWIMSAAFLESEQANLLIQTAHNIVYTIDSKLSVLAVNQSSEQSILYSGSIYPLPGGDALIAAGTVLNGVVVWQLKSQEVLHNMTTHEGSIFGVCFSSDGRKVASCSDDRSVRLWDLSDGSEVAVGWGHTGRIWALLFDGDQIISVSEDCTARIWRVIAKDDSEKELQSVQTLEGHLGRNAWCGAVNGRQRVLATGGADGRTRLWSLDRHNIIESLRESLSINQVVSEPQKKEMFKEFTNFSPKRLMIATSTAKLFSRNKETKKWTLVESVPLDTYSIIKGWESSDVCCVCTRNGEVSIIKFHRDDDKYTIESAKLDFKGKVSDILTFRANDELFYLCETQAPQDPFIIRKVGSDFSLSLSSPETFTATSCFYDEVSSVFYLGSRHGAVAGYKVDLSSSQQNVSPLGCWRRIMSEDTVTSGLILKRSSEDPARVTLLFTSRGGYYCIARSELSNDMMSFDVVSKSKLPRGSIEGSKLIDGGVLLYGFRNDLFFLWNETEQCEIMLEKCGGSHRNWSFTIDPTDEQKYELVYTKASATVIVPGIQAKDHFRYSVLGEGTHGREVRAIEVSPAEFGGTKVMATGSEDTTIRFCSFDSAGTLKTHTIQRQHVSGLQSVHWTPDGKFLLSSSAREELFVWKVECDSDGSVLQVYANLFAKLPTSSDVPDLRIMDFALYPTGTDQYLLATVYSDSGIRLWIMDLSSSNEARFELLMQGIYRSCCILNCNFLTQDSRLFLATSSTDGHLVAYDVTSLLTNTTPQKQPADLPGMIFRSQLHQSSIRSAAFKLQSDGTFIYVSGGDDNALIFSEVNFVGKSVKVNKKVSSAHSATINSVSLVSNGQVVTTSVDQNVRLWDIGGELISTSYTTVADTGPLDSVDNTIVFGGSGLSIWSLEE